MVREPLPPQDASAFTRPAPPVTPPPQASSAQAPAGPSQVAPPAPPRDSSHAPSPGGSVRSGPRRVNLTLGRLDPWSVMKLGFLMSVAIGIAMVIMTAVLWLILDAMGVFTDIDRTVGTVLGTSSGAEFDLMDYAGFGRVLSLATVIAVIDVFLVTALSTLGALLYNMSTSLVGGVQVTLTDD
ncbi:MAG: DUF3566 domain-containing protein [Angustibacter sp.]